MWKGDRVAACVAAASVVAKVTRDRLMAQLHERWPRYGFDEHKGYVTEAHNEAIGAYGPCPEHRFSYVNVARRAGADAGFRADRSAVPSDTENGRADVALRAIRRARG